MFNIMNTHLPHKAHAVRSARWCITAIAALATAFLLTQTASAQQPAGQGGDLVYIDNDEYLEDVVGRIALYPDPLIGVVLPASTYPLQIVQAARFLEEHEHNPALQPNPDWDDSVIALLNYPEVLAMMNEDLDWTWSLGDAVLYDQNEVLAAIQDFRDRAYLAGNLRSDDYQLVERNDTVIEVVPVQQDVIHVPYYEPRRVVYYQPAPVIWYYPRAYPVYYYPYPIDYLFPTRYFWGVTTVFSIGWRTRLVHVHHHHYSGHPYFGVRYHVPYYVRAPRTVTNINIHIDNRRGDVWQPGYRGGSRPQSVSVRDSDRRNVGDYTDRRTDTARPRSGAAATTTASSNRINDRFDARVASRSSSGSASRSAVSSADVNRSRAAGDARPEGRPGAAGSAAASATAPRASERRTVESPDATRATRAERPAATRAPAAATAPTPSRAAPAARAATERSAASPPRSTTQRAEPRGNVAQGNPVQRNLPQRTERQPATAQRVTPAPTRTQTQTQTRSSRTTPSPATNATSRATPAGRPAPAPAAPTATRAAPSTRATPSTSAPATSSPSTSARSTNRAAPSTRAAPAPAPSPSRSTSRSTAAPATANPPAAPTVRGNRAAADTGTTSRAARGNSRSR